MLTVLGLDIGTTSISGVLLNGESGEVIKTLSVPNDSVVSVEKTGLLQDPERIVALATKLKKQLQESAKNISAIGITGQMHGILYVDTNGLSVSPLYTWQCSYGNFSYKQNTYAKTLSEMTGYNLASGYGLVTEYYLRNNGLAPENSVKICTIHDYLAMRLTNRKTPIIHISDAASFGCFNIAESDFDRKALDVLGIDSNLLPEIVDTSVIIGETEESTPVTVPIGDNQASFIGSTNGLHNLLVNIGTGSQISLITDRLDVPEGMEIRPLDKKKNIVVGASLCGGRAYSILKDFFMEFAKQITGKETDIYAVMEKMAAEQEKSTLSVDTCFCGTRKDQNLRGCISGISDLNFTPGQLILGFKYGITNELYGFLERIDPQESYSCIVGSGNAIRQSQSLKHCIEDVFKRPLKIPLHLEEAAFGAALYSAVAIQGYKDIETAQSKLVHYKEC